MLADIERLSVAERIQLVEDIWDTIAADTERIPVTTAQKNELDRRLEAYDKSKVEAIWKSRKGK